MRALVAPTGPARAAARECVPNSAPRLAESRHGAPSTSSSCGFASNDYDGSNFVVRQVFFCGGDRNEFAAWKKGLSRIAEAKARRKTEQTLKLEIDAEAFARLYGHQSHPFPVKPGARVAVRVVSQFGEETTRVLEIG